MFVLLAQEIIMTTTRKYIRRSRQQWSELIELQSDSGLSIPKFCEQAGFSYQRFMAWRKRITTPEKRKIQSPEFVELTSSEQTAAAHQSPSVNHWQIELEMGDSIQLRIAQR